MDLFLEFIKDRWAMISGLIMAAVWFGMRENKLAAIEASQKEHRKLHAELNFVAAKTCSSNQTNIEKLSQAKFDAGAQQFQDIKNLIAANDAANLARHTETMGMMKALMEMNR